ELHHDTEARGRRALNEAENVATPETAALRMRLAALAQIEIVVRESAKPLEHISDIKIVHFDGLAASGQGGSADAASPNVSLSDQVMSSALKYRLQAPLVDSLLKSAGINPTDTTGLLRP
nr:flotillin family protein [Lautropia sp.]